ncbi:helix-turn-helix transcriptional regulator [Streptomyces sp. NPDC052299]|uniref:helix-turn-helix domain-containing protein n=1 Tax=Streptomyces sp. NPDC052299 TaxID=3155054 RepID=UPI0034125C32
MGRREKEITTSNVGLRRLAEWLRMQRAWAGLTYRELADRAGLHATTLQRAASGASVPRLTPVLAYAQACDAPPEEARRLWRQARREHVRDQHARHPAPSPRLVRDFADLSAALRDVYEQAGAPSLRTMEKRAGEFGVLPRSSAHRVVNKQMVPHTLEQFRGFLRACEVPPDWKVWEDAWNRAWRFEKQEDAGLSEMWAMPRPVRDRQGTGGEDMSVVVGDKGRGSGMRGPEYYRPMVPRQRHTFVAKITVPTSRVKRRAADPALRRHAAKASREAFLDSLFPLGEQRDTETLF